MHEDEVAPHGAVVESETLRKKTWYRRADAFVAIGLAFVAGMRAQGAIQRFRAGKSYDWSETLLILSWLVLSIVLTSRASAMNRDTASSASNISAIK